MELTPSESFAIDDPLLTIREVEALCGIRKSLIYQMMKEEPPKFPLPRVIGGGSVRWFKSEIETWRRALPQRTVPRVNRAMQSAPRATAKSSSAPPSS